MANLTDLDVDRVDAVDQPATRRRFLIMKDESGGAAGDPIAEARALLDAATSAVSTIEKSAGLAELDDDVADALDALAKAVGSTTTFADRKRAARAAAAAAADAAKAEPAAKSEGAPDLASLADAIGQSLAKSLQPVVDGQAAILRTLQGVESLDTGEPLRRLAPPSSQPAGQPVAKSAPRKYGEGLFAGVFHG